MAAVLVLSSCSSAYQTAQTPDDVYHSPARPQTVYASNTVRNTQSNAVEETYDDNGNTYVTYQDEDEERYDYARRIDNFSRGYRGNYWDGYYYDDFYGSPNVYINNYYGSRWGSWGSYWGPSVSIGFGWGYNPYRWGGWYSPWYGYSNPWHGWYGSGWYGSYYPGWYGSGWYGGGYPGGWHGGGGYYTRPSNSWGPRGSSNSRVFNNTSNWNASGNRSNSSGVPRRTFTPRSTTNSGGINDRNVRDVPRRNFQPSPTERAIPQRSYNPPSSDRSIPQRSNYEPRSAPAPQRSAPERSYTPPPPSNSSSGSDRGSAPARTFRPRGG